MVLKNLKQLKQKFCPCPGDIVSYNQEVKDEKNSTRYGCAK
jgi:hypothetical protein